MTKYFKGWVLPVLCCFSLLAILTVCPTSVCAEERELEIGRWYPSVESGFTLTQSTYSDNWSGGDKGTIVWTFITNATLENQFSPKVNFSNMLKLAYGQTHQQSVDEQGERYWERPEKSSDLIDFETLLRFTMGWVVDPYVSGRFESQFQDASDPLGRTLSLNPMRFKESGGVARKFIDTEDQSLLSRVGFTLRQTRRKLFENATATTADITESTNDGGIEWNTDFNTKILNKRVTWTSKLTAFQPLFYSKKDAFDDLTSAQLRTAELDADLADFVMAADIDWENIFTTQITKLLSVNLYLRWLYDKYDNSVPPILTESGEISNSAEMKAAIRKAVQIKQTLALGVTYRFL
jgi:hypothetical protein